MFSFFPELFFPASNNLTFQFPHLLFVYARYGSVLRIIVDTGTITTGGEGAGRWKCELASLTWMPRSEFF